jgi:DNA-binding transcriptional MocR family regulator
MRTYFDYANAVRDSKSLTSTEKLVALIIASHFNWAEMNPSFPSNEKLSQETSLNRSTIIRAKNNLVSKGWLVSKQRFNTSNIYTPSIPSGTEGLGGRTVTLGGRTEGPQGSHKENLIDNITNNLTDNLKDNNQGNQEEEGLFLDLTKEDIKKLSLDKDIYLKIIKNRGQLGIFD